MMSTLDLLILIIIAGIIAVGFINLMPFYKPKSRIWNKPKGEEITIADIEREAKEIERSIRDAKEKDMAQNQDQ